MSDESQLPDEAEQPEVASPSDESNVDAAADTDAPMMEDLLERLVKGLVDKPEEVTVEGFDESDGSVTLELRVAEDEAGKVIGRGGRTINALRQIVRAHTEARGRKVVVDLVD
ncbi:MAG: KH domain-containing protein [Solirubrobacterales bacterium]